MQENLENIPMHRLWSPLVCHLNVLRCALLLTQTPSYFMTAEVGQWSRWSGDLFLYSFIYFSIWSCSRCITLTERLLLSDKLDDGQLPRSWNRCRYSSEAVALCRMWRGAVRPRRSNSCTGICWECLPAHTPPVKWQSGAAAGAHFSFCYILVACICICLPLSCTCDELGASACQRRTHVTSVHPPLVSRSASVSTAL